MKIKTIFLLLALILLSIQHAKATAPLSMPLKELDNAADEILQLTKMKHYKEAKLLLQSFSDEISGYTKKTNLLSLDEVRVLHSVQNQAIEAITNDTALHEQKLKYVISFRLAVDALNSKYQPLWTNMRESVMSPFQSAIEAAANGDFDEFQANLNTFLMELSIIEPSLSVDIPTSQLEKLNAKISFVDKFRGSIMQNPSERAKLEELGNDLDHVFNDMSRDETDPSLWWVIFTTGSIIIFTLSYVGWRKYNGQKQDKKRIEHND
ncbi:sporulation protein YpjB [Bacillus sp. FJAT-49736]|uniref:sporulation protein YpjB n=1 Tax=Bacillus sp. FJAT-49736 TaxID=2833582 RepID=UPI001BC8D4A0|nr:sporulation protein YpjB [Bacillus sp. FJAT-49736]MBS4173261.1 sporulation protein YpjB [Bacillus sp. FJAT-49736]